MVLEFFEDKVVLDLLSLFLTSAGIFSVLTRFYVPQLNHTYIGFNPHAIKRDAVDLATTWIFLILGLIGVMIGAFTIILGDTLKRQHSQIWYFTAFFVGMCAVLLLTFLLGKIGKVLAARIWMPDLGPKYIEDLEHLHFMVGNENSYSGKYKKKHRIDSKISEESFRRANIESAYLMIRDLEILFDIKSNNNPWSERLQKVHLLLKRYE